MSEGQFGGCIRLALRRGARQKQATVSLCARLSLEREVVRLERDDLCIIRARVHSNRVYAAVRHDDPVDADREDRNDDTPTIRSNLRISLPSFACLLRERDRGSRSDTSQPLAPPTDAEWKYVSVRRSFIFLERSIDKGTQRAVFEPNAEPLWSRLRCSIGTFLEAQWRFGAFQGADADGAYLVRATARR